MLTIQKLNMNCDVHQPEVHHLPTEQSEAAESLSKCHQLNKTSCDHYGKHSFPLIAYV